MHKRAQFEMHLVRPVLAAWTRSEHGYQPGGDLEREALDTRAWQAIEWLRAKVVSPNPEQ